MKPTAGRVRELLAYEASTGVFRWKYTRRNMISGEEAGSLNQKGYRQISIDGTKFAASHLAWLYVTGEWPVLEIDHRDTNRGNNAFKNLRQATREEQCQNLSGPRKNSKTKLIGAAPHGGGFQSQIRANGRNHYLGKFKTAEQASAAYLKAKRRLHPSTVNLPNWAIKEES